MTSQTSTAKRNETGLVASNQRSGYPRSLLPASAGLSLSLAAGGLLAFCAMRQGGRP